MDGVVAQYQGIRMLYSGAEHEGQIVLGHDVDGIAGFFEDDQVTGMKALWHCGSTLIQSHPRHRFIRVWLKAPVFARLQAYMQISHTGGGTNRAGRALVVPKQHSRRTDGGD